MVERRLVRVSDDKLAATEELVVSGNKGTLGVLRYRSTKGRQLALLARGACASSRSVPGS